MRQRAEYEAWENRLLRFYRQNCPISPELEILPALNPSSVAGIQRAESGKGKKKISLLLSPKQKK